MLPFSSPAAADGDGRPLELKQQFPCRKCEESSHLEYVTEKGLRPEVGGESRPVKFSVSLLSGYRPADFGMPSAPTLFLPMSRMPRQHHSLRSLKIQNLKK